MSKVALVVDLKIADGQLDAFLARAREHAAACLAEEEGCLHFDILVPLDGSSRVFLYEVYADQAAVDTHLATPRMAQYLEDTKAMITERVRNACTLANQ